jgi:hypothetical protein
VNSTCTCSSTDDAVNVLVQVVDRVLVLTVGAAQVNPSSALTEPAGGPPLALPTTYTAMETLVPDLEVLYFAVPDTAGA